MIARWYEVIMTKIMIARWYEIIIRILLIIPYYVIIILFAFIIFMGWGKDNAKKFLHDYWLSII